MTKEELIRENTQLISSVNLSRAKSTKIRNELAKAFGWNEDNLYRKSIEEPSWEEIFIEIGRLLESRNQQNNQKELEALRTEIDNLKNTVDENI
jgi:hypothetical protein